MSQLKKFKGSVNDVYYSLMVLSNDIGPILQPEQVLKTRTILKELQTVPQILVKWKDLDTFCSTWEDKTYMHSSYHALEDETIDVTHPLEDKMAATSIE